MMLLNVLADALRSVSNARERGQWQILIRPCCKVIVWFLKDDEAWFQWPI
jgi:ribosomal protein S8